METKNLDAYSITVNSIPLQIQIYSQKGHPTSYYHLSLLNLTKETKLIIEKLREQIITEISFDLLNKKDEEGEQEIKEQFKSKIMQLIKKNFTELDENTLHFLSNYVVITSLGLAELEFLLKDPHLEEIVINNAKEPVWVYHRKFGWLKTNIKFEDENKIRHFATMIGRNVDKGITLLDPLLDAHLKTGDRVNATLSPITTKGNTITIRKFAEKPWTIVDFLKNKTIDYWSAALIWLALQYELSVLIAGGTGSGKTSFLNVICNFLPPNQRVISIEDTRELRLSKNLHWVPMQSRVANPEGKGEITMLDCMVNTLRMRPDRIIVGEVRREKEVEVMFEAMHTGHSVYTTIHASNVNETFTRLTNPPINLPVTLLTSLGLIVVQHRNRRTGIRRTFQLAEINPDGTPKLVLQHDALNDVMKKVSDPETIYDVINLYSGMSNSQIYKDLEEKTLVLKWLVKNNITDVNELGLIMSDYYTDKIELLNKITGDVSQKEIITEAR
ncbi:type II/IV secretion system ATPase subunit [Candidatus Woesearchaeota archaeon]|nr:type II/IV secretion system ATPase subunit [Candidatus Woesearchaeota archaeon]